MPKIPEPSLGPEARAILAQMLPLYDALCRLNGSNGMSKDRPAANRLITQIAALSARMTALGITAEMLEIELLAPGGGQWRRCPRCEGRGHLPKGGPTEPSYRSVDGEP